MKRIMLSIGGLILLIFNCFSQNLTEVQAKELFGERFIGAEELGLSNQIEIPFTKEDIMNDKSSWLIPIKKNDAFVYLLVQVRYSPNEYQKNDTLNQKEAEEVIKTLCKTNRNFPDDKNIKFFKTKDVMISIEGKELRKAVMCHSGTYENVLLPENAKVVLLGKNYISYIYKDISDNFFIDMDVENKSDIKNIESFSIMTLICLRK